MQKILRIATFNNINPETGEVVLKPIALVDEDGSIRKYTILKNQDEEDYSGVIERIKGFEDLASISASLTLMEKEFDGVTRYFALLASGSTEAEVLFS